MYDLAYKNRMHQISSVICAYGERGVTRAELTRDIRLNGINPSSMSSVIRDLVNKGHVTSEKLPGNGPAGQICRYFASNENLYSPKNRTGGDRVNSRKTLTNAILNKDGSFSISRESIGKEFAKRTSHNDFRLYFQNEEQVLGLIELLISNIENFTYLDELDVDVSAVPKSPIGTDPSFWKSKKTTAKIGSVTPPDIGRETQYPQLAKGDKRGKR